LGEVLKNVFPYAVQTCLAGAEQPFLDINGSAFELQEAFTDINISKG
jgi:hypothetical protein